MCHHKWTKVHQFRENRNHSQKFTDQSFPVSELWPIYFHVFGKPKERATSPLNFMGQSSETKKVLRDQILNFGSDSHNFAVFELWPTKFWGHVALPEGYPKVSQHVSKVHQF